jgi:hypothetical protein
MQTCSAHHCLPTPRVASCTDDRTRASPRRHRRSDPDAIPEHKVANLYRALAGSTRRVESDAARSFLKLFGRSTLCGAARLPKLPHAVTTCTCAPPSRRRGGGALRKGCRRIHGIARRRAWRSAAALLRVAGRRCGSLKANLQHPEQSCTQVHVAPARRHVARKPTARLPLLGSSRRISRAGEMN